jgi:hypothetical protein
VAQAISSSRVMAMASVLLAAVDQAAGILNRLPDVVPAVTAKASRVDHEAVGVRERQLSVDGLRLITKRAFDVGLRGHGVVSRWSVVDRVEHPVVLAEPDDEIRGGDLGFESAIEHLAVDVENGPSVRVAADKEVHLGGLFLHACVPHGDSIHRSGAPDNQAESNN